MPLTLTLRLPVAVLPAASVALTTIVAFEVLPLLIAFLSSFLFFLPLSLSTSLTFCSASPEPLAFFSFSFLFFLPFLTLSLPVALSSQASSAQVALTTIFFGLFCFFLPLTRS